MRADTTDTLRPSSDSTAWKARTTPVTRLDALTWETMGSPTGVCISCSHYRRLGLDRCSHTDRSCQ